jgi:LuxR family maltose regulon positive regulatory protein
MSDWMQTMEQLGHLTFVVASAFALADLLTAQGNLQSAIRAYEQSLQMAAAQGPEAERITAHHHLGLALLWCEMDQAEMAAPHLQKARELGEQTTLVDWPYRWHLAQARLAEAEGNLEGALAELDEAQRLYVKNPVPDLRPVAALKARLHLKQGRLPQAQAWAQDRRLAATDALSYLREFEHLTLARVLIAAYQAGQGDHPLLEALDLLARLLTVAEAQGRLGNALEILVVQALAYQVQGRLPLAFAALQHALELAQPQGYVRIFVDEGEPMRLLIGAFRAWIERQAPGQGQALTGYVDRLLAAFVSPAASPSSALRHPQSAIVEPLSDRELEILRLVAQGLSNREIAQRLFLAISTVKGHNLKIFGKLQVQSRTEAIARARELGWL